MERESGGDKGCLPFETGEPLVGLSKVPVWGLRPNRGQAASLGGGGGIDPTQGSGSESLGWVGGGGGDHGEILQLMRVHGMEKRGGRSTPPPPPTPWLVRPLGTAGGRVMTKIFSIRLCGNV